MSKVIDENGLARYTTLVKNYVNTSSMESETVTDTDATIDLQNGVTYYVDLDKVETLTIGDFSNFPTTENKNCSKIIFTPITRSPENIAKLPIEIKKFPTGVFWKDGNVVLPELTDVTEYDIYWDNKKNGRIEAFKYSTVHEYVDYEGLKAIGWTDEDINFLEKYAWWTLDKKNNYKVTSKDKQYYDNNTQNIDKYCGKQTTYNNLSYCSGLFTSCENLICIPKLNTSNITQMDYMFSAGYIGTANPPTFVSNKALVTIPSIDTSNVTNMDGMFNACEALTLVPYLNMSKVESCNDMFSGCKSLITITNIELTNAVPYAGTKQIDMFTYSNFQLGSSSPITVEPPKNLKNVTFTGSINVGLDMQFCTNLSYKSIKSLLTAASKTTNTDKKTLTLSMIIKDQNSELANLVSTCTSKGWTIAGLTLQ